MKKSRTPISLTVHGTPEPQARPRYGSGHFFSPKTVWWHKVQFAARLNRPKPALEGPVHLILSFYMPRPKSAPQSIVWHRTRPDIDNLAKAVMDAMTTAGWWLDDGQVAVLEASKQYIAEGEKTSVLITASEI